MVSASRWHTRPLAADPARERWNQRSLSSGQLAREYGFTDLDGSRPDIWRYIEEVRERGRDGGHEGYRERPRL